MGKTKLDPLIREQIKKSDKTFHSPTKADYVKINFTSKFKLKKIPDGTDIFLDFLLKDGKYEESNYRNNDSVM